MKANESNNYLKITTLFGCNLYKLVSLLMGFTFSVVGLIFLFYSDEVLLFFNTISYSIGKMSPVNGVGFYLVLAVGYMYLVALLAFLMYFHPENIYFPFLLMNGKFSSSILSFYFFVFHGQYLIFITNGIVDGLIGLMVFIFYRKMKKLPG
jgi:hypothetical protein